ncbi:hypothetical protein EJ07DRAFT_181948 [Lizonia empirigonia]|nr:hypothetical protein EJ07DRAFT_181948 [Lizonia empirigonia]
MASSLQDEAIRHLGSRMNIPPSFFMLPGVRLRVVAGADHSYFTLQYVDKYTVRHATSQVQEPTSLQLYRFRSMHGQQSHEWRFTQARLIFLTNGASNHKSTNKSDVPENQYACWRGLYIFDSPDDSMALQLKELMTANDRPDPDQIELYQGVGQIIENVIYLINSRWSEFFDDADVHLRVLSKECVSGELSSAKQLQYMQELHGLSPVWTTVRRHLTAIKDLIAQILQHEISYSIRSEREQTQIYYIKRLQVIDDHINRCNDAAAQTNNLISLVFNIATLQESRAAVEESKAANAFAGSIRRVTMLTFIYLPLKLASSILGMNIVQITGEGTHSQLWLYFVIAVALTAATFGGWFVWSRLLSRLERKLQQRASMRVATGKGV